MFSIYSLHLEGPRAFWKRHFSKNVNAEQVSLSLLLPESQPSVKPLMLYSLYRCEARDAVPALDAVPAVPA